MYIRFELRAGEIPQSIHKAIHINLSAKLVKRKQTTKCYDSFFIPIIKIISFYAVKKHKMKTNEAIHLVTEYPIHLVTESLFTW